MQDSLKAERMGAQMGRNSKREGLKKYGRKLVCLYFYFNLFLCNLDYPAVKFIKGLYNVLESVVAHSHAHPQAAKFK